MHSQIKYQLLNRLLFKLVEIKFQIITRHNFYFDGYFFSIEIVKMSLNRILLYNLFINSSF